MSTRKAITVDFCFGGPPQMDGWMITDVDVSRDGRFSTRTYLKIPEGETAEGFGRRWGKDDTEARLVCWKLPSVAVH